jgi:hypothetical protein
MAGDRPITTKIDGRTERRDRNRTAVLDALLDLVEEGNLAPTVPEISERCGISHRSVFDISTTWRRFFKRLPFTP